MKNGCLFIDGEPERKKRGFTLTCNFEHLASSFKRLKAEMDYLHGNFDMHANYTPAMARDHAHLYITPNTITHLDTLTII